MKRVWKGGTPTSNYGTVVLVNNTALTLSLTVPTGENWWLYGGKILNGDDVARNCVVVIDDGTNVLLYLLNDAVAAGLVSNYPNTVSSAYHYNGGPISLKSGWRISFTWAAGGASAGGTGQYSAIVRRV